jgi:DNA mismatch repair protein MutH
LNNTIIDILKSLEGQYLNSIDVNDSISSKRKDYSRAVIDLYLNNKHGNSPKEYLSKVGLVLKTTPISHGSLMSVEPLRLCSLSLRNFIKESWDETELNSVLKGMIILPLIVEAKNLGQSYRKVGKTFIWIPDSNEKEEIKNEWLWYQSYALKGAVPNKRGERSTKLTFPTEAASKFIHMKPHSSKGKFESDAFGNQVRRMAFYLNPSYLRSLLLRNLANE